MYEEKKFKPDINWKSLIIKMVILLLIVFIICFIAFKPKKAKETISLESNIIEIKEAAIKYFKDKNDLKLVGDNKKITLKTLIKEDLIEKQKDEAGNKCSTKESYATLTKTSDNEYSLKINLECGNNKETKNYKLTTEDIPIKEIEKVEDEKEPEKPVLEEDTIKVEINKDEAIKEEEAKEEQKNNSSNNNSSSTSKNELSGSVVFKPATDNKVLRYKHIKYGEWIEGTKDSNSIETSTKTVNFYQYCLNGYCVTDREENSSNYEGYTATFSHSENIPIYRYVYVVWSNSSCVVGFTNTGITEYQ